MEEAVAQARELDFSQGQRGVTGVRDTESLAHSWWPGSILGTENQVRGQRTAILGRDSGGLSYDGGPEWRSVQSPEVR